VLPLLRGLGRLPLVIQVNGPNLVIFKPGYGRWQRRLSGEVEVMALPPARTRDERLKAMSRASYPAIIPQKYTIRMDEAVQQERVYLGLK
jgi:hypothetical protein